MNSSAYLLQCNSCLIKNCTNTIAYYLIIFVWEITKRVGENTSKHERVNSFNDDPISKF